MGQEVIICTAYCNIFGKTSMLKLLNESHQRAEFALCLHFQGPVFRRRNKHVCRIRSNILNKLFEYDGDYIFISLPCTFITENIF